jgi:hypothetical protein
VPGGVGTPSRSAASPAESALAVAKCRCAEWGDGLDRPSSLHCSSLISASRSASCSSNTRTRSLSACSCRASSAAPTLSSSDEGCGCCASPCALLRGSLQTSSLEHLCAVVAVHVAVQVAVHVARCALVVGACGARGGDGPPTRTREGERSAACANAASEESRFNTLSRVPGRG